MAVLSRRHNYLFLQAPNAASTAIGHLLRQEFHGQRFVRKHATLDEIAASGQLDVPRSSLFVFTSVRNPFDALVSRWARSPERLREAREDPNHWLNSQPKALAERTKAAELQFPDWIQWSFDGRHDQTMYSKFSRGADFVVHFEALQGDLVEALARVGLSLTQPLQQTNRTDDRDPERDYRSYYTPPSRAMVEAAFAEELEELGYEFDGPVDRSEGP
jgi:hypothetical protein